MVQLEKTWDISRLSVPAHQVCRHTCVLTNTCMPPLLFVSSFADSIRCDADGVRQDHAGAAVLVRGGMGCRGPRSGMEGNVCTAQPALRPFPNRDRLPWNVHVVQNEHLPCVVVGSGACAVCSDRTRLLCCLWWLGPMLGPRAHITHPVNIQPSHTPPQVCTQPRRVACTSVASRVADEMGCALGDKVSSATEYRRANLEFLARFLPVMRPLSPISYDHI